MERSTLQQGACIALLLLAAGYCCVGPGIGAADGAARRQLRAYSRWRFSVDEQDEGALGGAGPTAQEQLARRRWLQEVLPAAAPSDLVQPPPPPPSPPLARTDLRQQLTALLSPATDVQWSVVWDEVEPVAASAMVVNETSSNTSPNGTATGAPQGGAAPSPQPALTDLDQLMACVNQGKELRSAMSWIAATKFENVSVSLRAVASFTLNATAAEIAAGNMHPPPPHKPVVTLVTASSIDRLQQLHAQCRAWPGALSAVLFVGLLQEGNTEPQGRAPLLPHTMAAVQDALLQVAHFMMEMRSAPHACKPTILLTYEVYSDRESMILYPVNLLRNLARIQAQSPLIAMLDVDLLPSKTMANRLVAHESSAQLLLSSIQKDKAVYIVPAFEPAPEFETASWAEALASSPSKEIMVMAMDKGIVTPFHFSRWAVGHAVTNFTRWHDGSTDFDVKYQTHCEPWLVGDRLAMPWYDVRYRGFGYNKMQHVLNLANDGWSFRVLGDSYCIHRPHKVVDAKGLFMLRTVTHQGLTSLRQHVEAMYNAQVGLGVNGKFQAPVSAAEVLCRNSLHWWPNVTEAQPQQQQQSTSAGPRRALLHRGMV